MGMNWRAGLQLASTGLRMDRERKREYERADREMAMPMAQLLAQQGMPIPDNIKNMMGPMTQQLMPYLEEAVRTGKQRELEDAITKYETQKNIDWLYDEPTAPQTTGEERMFEIFAGMPLDKVKELPNDMRRKLMTDWAASKRKEDQVKTLRPRYQIIKNESTGKITRINVDTGEEEIVRDEDPALMKKAKAKEEAERIKQEKADAKEANDLYEKWVKNGRIESDLDNLNNALKVFGHQVVPIKEPGTFWGENITGYKYGKIGGENTFNDADITETARTTGMAPEQVKQSLESKGMIYDPTR